VRRARAIPWVLAAACALLWAVSIPWSVFLRVTRTGPTVGVGAGAAVVLLGPASRHGLTNGAGPLIINRVREFPGTWFRLMFWLPDVQRLQGQYRLPLWMPLVLAGAWGVRDLFRRPKNSGECAGCGYQAAGLARCPECGLDQPPANRASSDRHSA
jgi:hypothetical protein